LLGYRTMKRAAFVPFWAWQFLVGVFVVILAVAVFATVVGAALRAPSGFLDEVGKTMSKVVPQQSADVGTEAELKGVLAAMPHGRLRVATIDTDHNRVIFTVTVERSAVKAAVQPGDELRIARDGGVEIVPTGIPGVVDQLQRAFDDLKRRFFGQ